MSDVSNETLRLLGRRTRRAARPEVHYWDRFSHSWPTDADVALYHQLFPRPPGTLTGEKTPDYMACYWVPPMLRHAAPEARIIVLLRDPIERYRSGQALAARVGWARNALVESYSFERGLYAAQVARLRDAFDPGQLLILQYERCVLDAADQISRTYEFLGLPAHQLSDKQLTRGGEVSRGSTFAIDPPRLATLRAAYEPDVLALSRDLPELDLSLWPNFSHLDGR